MNLSTILAKSWFVDTFQIDSLDELIESQVSKLVLTKLVSLGGISIVLMDLFHVVGKNLQTVDELRTILDVHLILGDVVKEFLLVVLHTILFLEQLL